MGGDTNSGMQAQGGSLLQLCRQTTQFAQHGQAGPARLTLQSPVDRTGDPAVRVYGLSLREKLKRLMAFLRQVWLSNLISDSAASK